MDIKTSHWFQAVPADHIKIGVSRGVPRGQPAGYRRYKDFNPGPWFNSVDTKTYFELYTSEILGLLNAGQVVADLEKLAGGKTPVLVCYEKPATAITESYWCHRGLISAWFKLELGLDVPELGHETKGVGWAHPMLPPSLREKVPLPLAA